MQINSLLVFCCLKLNVTAWPLLHVLGAVLPALLVSFKNKSIMKYDKCFFVVLSSHFMIYLAHHFLCTTVFTYQKFLSKNL